jgi:nucleoside phosphorylase
MSTSTASLGDLGRSGSCGGVDTGRLGTARVGILTIIDEEFDAMRAVLQADRNVPHSPYYTNAASLDVILRQAPDRANVPATSAAARLVEDFRPEVVAVVGIAGGIEGRDGVALGDVVVASYLHYSEFRKLAEAGDLRRYYAYDQPAVSLRDTYVDPERRDGSWIGRIAGARPAEGQPKVIVGSIVAGEKILGNPTHEEQQRVVREFTDAVAVDMESVGVARAVHDARTSVDYSPRLLVVRGVSDLVRAVEPVDLVAAAEQNAGERATWKAYAAWAAATFAHAVALRFLSSPDIRRDLRRESV